MDKQVAEVSGLCSTKPNTHLNIYCISMIVCCGDHRPPLL